MMNKRIIILISLLIISIILAGCIPALGNEDIDSEDIIELNTEKILRTNNPSEPGYLDPALAQGTHESWILEHIFEGLMKLDSSGHIVPGMAKEYSISEDGLTYTFVMREDIKWSNGDPVTAHDFEFSWKRTLHPEISSNYAFQLYYIRGAEEYNKVIRPGKYKDPQNKNQLIVNPIDPEELLNLEVAGKYEEEINDMVYEKRLLDAGNNLGVKALNDKILEVTLISPTGYFLELTAFYTYSPVNRNITKNYPNWAREAETLVSNGPFNLTEWNYNENIKIRKNKYYYDAANVTLDGIDFTINEDLNEVWERYKNGDYDLLAELPQSITSELIEQKNPELITGGIVGTYYYNLNTEIKPFNNIKVRKGLSLTIDRQMIVNEIIKGGQLPAEGIIPFGMFDENGEEYRDKAGILLGMNIDQGKKLFKQGLAEEKMKAENLNGMTLLYNKSDGHKEIAEAIIEMWKQNLGIEIQLEEEDFQIKIFRENTGDFEISRAGWIGDYMDPMTFINVWLSDSSFNDANYSNSAYDKLVLTAKNTADQKIRFNSMRKAEEILMKDMPIIPIYYYTQQYAQKQYVSGVYKPLMNYPRLTYANIIK